MRSLPVLLMFPLLAAAAGAADWPQFRGPNCGGISAAKEHLPDKIGPNTNVVWKTALPPGHSSPVVVGERIYLTAERDKRLLTLALDCKDGRILWEREAPALAAGRIYVRTTGHLYCFGLPEGR